MVDGGPCHLNLDKCHFGAFALLFFLGEQPRIICSFTNTATCQTAMCNVSPPFAGVYLSASSWSSPCNGLAIWEVSTILSMQTWTNVKMAGGMSLHAAWRHVEH